MYHKSDGVLPWIDREIRSWKSFVSSNSVTPGKSITSPNQTESTMDKITESDEPKTVLLQGYNIIARFVDPKDEMYRLRTYGHVGHKHVTYLCRNDRRKGES